MGRVRRGPTAATSGSAVTRATRRSTSPAAPPSRVGGSTYVAFREGAVGLVDFGSGGGTLSTRTLYALPAQLTGTGTINAYGWVGDLDLVFDATRGAKQTFTLASLPGQDVTVNLDVSGGFGVAGDLGVGYRGNSSLNVRDGITVHSESGYVGYGSGSTGVATIDGPGSTWIVFSDSHYPEKGDLRVGHDGGDGTLDITSGAAVRSLSGYIGHGSGSTGVVTVDGAGSTWIIGGMPHDPVGGDLHVGYSGSGRLDISNGGDVVTNTYSYLGGSSGSTAVVTVDGAGSTWTTRYLYLGYYNGDVTLDITGGGAVSDQYGCVGYSSGSTGVVTVDGAGSTWSHSEDLHVGRSGNGTLVITGGAIVSVGGSTYVASEAGSTGLIDFGSGGGTLATSTLFYASPAHFAGTGTIDTRGLVADLDLVFDSTHGTNQTLALASQPGQDVTIRLNTSGWAGIVGNLGAGYRANGSLSIRDGIAVYSASGYVGYASGSMGVATVDGTGSKWTNSGSLRVGYNGSGTLKITGGGFASSPHGYIGYNSGSTGVVTVDGIGSRWSNNADLYVGYQGSGTLEITGGGIVSSVYGRVGQYSGSTGVVTVEGAGSRWTVERNLYVGDSGSGTLEIAGGGAVTAESVSIMASRCWRSTLDAVARSPSMEAPGKSTTTGSSASSPWRGQRQESATGQSPPERGPAAASIRELAGRGMPSGTSSSYRPPSQVRPVQRRRSTRPWRSGW